MNGICTVIGVIFLVCVAVSWHQGLFKVVLSVVGLILSMVVAVYISPRISTYLQENTKIDEQISERIAETLPCENEGGDISRSMQIAAINELPLSEGMVDNLLDNNNSEVYNLLNASDVYDYIAKSAAIIIMNAVVFLVLTAALHLVIFFVGRAANLFKKLPIVKSIDKFGGAAVGVVKGLIFIWIFFLVLSVTRSFAWSQELVTQITQSWVLKLLYDNNLILDIVGDLSRILFH